MSFVMAHSERTLARLEMSSVRLSTLAAKLHRYELFGVHKANFVSSFVDD
jgi:hypothetical protein